LWSEVPMLTLWGIRHQCARSTSAASELAKPSRSRPILRRNHSQWRWSWPGSLDLHAHSTNLSAARAMWTPCRELRRNRRHRNRSSRAHSTSSSLRRTTSPSNCAHPCCNRDAQARPAPGVPLTRVQHLAPGIPCRCECNTMTSWTETKRQSNYLGRGRNRRDRNPCRHACSTTPS